MNRIEPRAATARTRSASADESLAQPASVNLPSASGGYTVAGRKVAQDEADKIRADTVRLVLSEALAGLKVRLDARGWLNGGWAEVADFVEALCKGGMHPALIEWQADKDCAGHPALPSRELYARRLAVLMYVALERVEAFDRKIDARNFVAKKLADTGVLDSAPTAKVIEHWQQQVLPSLTPREEILVATGIATAGRDSERLAVYFLGLWHVAKNPTATIVHDNALELRRA
jgi:hypothetical protein